MFIPFASWAKHSKENPISQKARGAKWKTVKFQPIHIVKKLAQE